MYNRSLNKKTEKYLSPNTQAYLLLQPKESEVATSLGEVEVWWALGRILQNKEKEHCPKHLQNYALSVYNLISRNWEKFSGNFWSLQKNIRKYAICEAETESCIERTVQGEYGDACRN